MTFRQNMRPQRLLGAAELLLKALESQEGMNSRIPVHFIVPRADATAPSQRYTLMELVDAMTMLKRMGLVPVRRSIAAASRENSHYGHLLKLAFRMKGVVNTTMN